MTKALFFDIDGTLVSFNTHTIPQSTIAAIEKARENGHRIFIATGRPKAIINNISALQERQLIDGYITMNGAYCFVGDEVVYRSSIKPHEVKAMAQFCQERSIASFFVAEHHISICQPNALVKEIFYDFLHVQEAPVATFEEVLKEEIFQITPFVTHEEEEEVKLQTPYCEYGRWHPAFTDVTGKGNNKQKGIDEMIRHLNIPLEDTIAFGDGGNDISMLRHVGIGVAMGQAQTEVKEAADYITTSVDDDGIQKAMLHLGLI
ncbi:MAG: Cof-type HAD-IIB family hydrolase [Bacteroides sp.]